MSISQHPIPFDLDDVVQIRGTIQVTDAEDWAANLHPFDLDDPFAIVEATGWSGQRHYIHITASDKQTYTVWEDQFAQLVKTAVTGERGLFHLIAQHRIAQGR